MKKISGLSLLFVLAGGPAVADEVRCADAIAATLRATHKTDLMRYLWALADAGCRQRAREQLDISLAQVPEPAHDRARLKMAGYVATWCEAGCCPETQAWGTRLAEQAAAADPDVARALGTRLAQADMRSCGRAEPRVAGPAPSYWPAATLTAVGLAATVATVVLAGESIDSADAASGLGDATSPDECGGRTEAACQRYQEQLNDDADTYGWLAAGAGVAAGAALGVGIWLFIDPPGGDRAVSVAPLLGRGQAGVQAGFSF